MSLSTSVAAASMDWSMAKLQSSYSTALLKKTMDSTEEQAVSLIQDMLPSTPAQYSFDVWA